MSAEPWVSVLSLVVARGRRRKRAEPTRPSLLQRLAVFVESHPGRRLAEIATLVGANRGTARYYLRVLERNDGLLVVRGSAPARYFPPSTALQDLPPLAFLLRGRVLEVARWMIANPGCAQHDLTRHLEISRKVFREYADRMVEFGLIREVRQPHLCQYYPLKRLHDLLTHLPPENGTLRRPGAPK